MMPVVLQWFLKVEHIEVVIASSFFEIFPDTRTFLLT
jgi:3-isopropylmalate dehydratase small subunit